MHANHVVFLWLCHISFPPFPLFLFLFSFLFFFFYFIPICVLFCVLLMCSHAWFCSVSNRIPLTFYDGCFLLGYYSLTKWLCYYLMDIQIILGTIICHFLCTLVISHFLWENFHKLLLCPCSRLLFKRILHCIINWWRKADLHKKELLSRALDICILLWKRWLKVLILLLQGFATVAIAWQHRWSMLTLQPKVA